MANKLSAFILGLLFIVPVLNAKPMPDETSEEIFARNHCERSKILTFMVDEFDVMDSMASDKSPALFKAVLKDPKVTEDKSEEMQKYIKLLSDYVEKFGKNEECKSQNGDNILFEFYKIMKHFDGKRNKDLSPAAQIIEKSLKENGVDDIEKSIMEYFESFLKEFISKLEEFFKDLNDEEEEAEKGLMELFDKLQAEKDLKKKLELFKPIFVYWE